MKKIHQAENVPVPAYAFIDETDYAEVAVREYTPLVPAGTPLSTQILDSIVPTLKWVFLYVPGASVIHLMMVGMALLFFYDTPTFEMMAGTIGIAVAGIFMIMLGIGKLTDLRYLRVVASIFAAGSLASVVYAILAVLIPGDFFGFYVRMTLPLTLLVGYLVKRHTDRNTESD